MSWATSGNATLEGHLRHRRTMRLKRTERANALREEAMLVAGTGGSVPASLSAELRRLTVLQLRGDRVEAGLRAYLYSLTGSAYLPEEETVLVLPFPLSPGGSDGEAHHEEILEVRRA